MLAIGVGERTTPAGAEQLAREVFGAGLAHTVLAVPIAQERATMHLDTVCTMVDVDKIVMYPNVADSLTAYAVTVADGEGDQLELNVAEAEHFLIAAAKAMGIDTLHQIDTGLDPVTAEREQWDDGNNTLAIAPRVAVAYERNDETNDRLEDAGIEVLRIAGSELGSGRGGPRCMSCPISGRRSADLGELGRHSARGRPRPGLSSGACRHSAVTGQQGSARMAGPSESEAREFARAYRSFLEWIHSESVRRPATATRSWPSSPTTSAPRVASGPS